MQADDRPAQCPKILYSPKYNLRVPTWRRLHPFDLQKYRRVAAALQEFSDSFRAPREPVPLESLRRVHTDDHLQRVLHDRQTIATGAEVPLLRHVPWINRLVIEPMRWATQGTIDAVEIALEEGMAINLSGGYHHAKPDRAEGFCFLADTAVAIQEMRGRGVLQPDQTVLHLDVDAHMGNGLAHCFMDDPTVKLFDFYSNSIYPMGDKAAISRIDFGYGLKCTILGAEYLPALKEQLPAWLDLIQSENEVALAILNLGHDVLEQDPLTFMRLSVEDVYERDRYLVQELRSRRIPLVILLSGGYSHGVHTITAESLRRICRSATKAEPSEATAERDDGTDTDTIPTRGCHGAGAREA